MPFQSGDIDLLSSAILSRTESNDSTVTSDYAEIFKRYGVEYKIDDYYLEVGEITLSQGWVLHISVIKRQLPDLLSVLVPFLVYESISFKTVRDDETARKLLDGSLSYRLLGKLVCIYPENESRALYLAELLISLTHRFKGPAVPTDRQLGGCVYTCYRDHDPVTITESEAFKVDHKLRFKLPKGVSWPFQKITKPSVSKPRKFLQGKYLPVTIIKSDVKGCVLKAVNFQKILHPEWCIIKEGKGNMCSDDYGRDIKDRLEWQSFLHIQLADEFNLPKAIDCFEHRGNTYLVIEYIDGICLNNWLGELYHERQWKDLTVLNKLLLVDYLISILDIVQRLHERGYIHRDLSIENFIIDKNNQVALIDLELMYSENLRKPCPPFKWGTPGFMSPEQMAAATPTIYEDIFGLGALMIALFTGLSPDKMESSNYELILLELSNNYGNKRIIDLILRCHSIDTSERPSIKKIHEAIIQYLRDINAGTIE